MLSWTIGLLFGASGLIVMIAAIVSTPITEMFHSMRRKKDGAKSKVNTKIEEVKSTARELWDTWSWVVTVLKYAVLIVTSPLWIPMVIRRKFKQHDDPSSYTVAA